MLRVALVGVGGISPKHIGPWMAMEDVELVALCDIRPEQMEKYPDIHHYTDYKEMLEVEKPDILDICLPSYLHAEVSIYAMDRGIHVLCEKPIALKVEDVARVYEAARRNNVHFMVAQVVRFQASYEVVKDAFESGKYGKLLAAHMSRLSVKPNWSWDNWMMDEKRSGLVPFDLHVHDVDFMLYAFGMPKSHSVNRTKMPDQDYIQTTFYYDDFFITVEAGWFNSKFPFCGDYRFQFENAIIEKTAGGVKLYTPTEVVELEKAGVQDEEINMVITEEDPYENEIRYYIDCVKAGIEPDKVKEIEMQNLLEILTSL